MVRPLRLEYEGAVYHVTSRGNERAAIFRDDRDRARFLEILGSVVSSARWALHAYCLMGNHYHLLVETPLGNLSRGMQRLNGRYTQWFNFRHDRAGHLLQGRFKAILVEKESHLLELCRYVVLNPVRARMVASAGQWPWSNYRMTLGKTRSPEWLEVDWTLSQFSSRPTAAREIYRRFVAQGQGLRSPMKDVWGQIYLGGEVFRQEMDVRLKGQKLDSEIPVIQRRPWVTDLGAIKTAVAREFGRRPEELSRRRGGDDKMAAIYLSRELTNSTGAKIGRAFGVTGSQVSHVIKKIQSGASQALRKRIETVRRKIER
jgi:putative transposase